MREQGKRNIDFLLDAQLLEEIRQVLRRELRTHGGQRAVARAIGVGRSVIRKLLEMRAEPRPEHMALIREWAEDRPEVRVPLGALCLATLVAELDSPLRYDARLRIAETLAQVYAGSGADLPAWLADELGDRQ